MKYSKRQIPYEFGFSSQPLKHFDVKEKNEKRLQKLMKLPEAHLIARICRHYLQSFIPAPIENENEYWIISCFPSTDNAPVRISIWFPEVFNIAPARSYFGYHSGLQCMVFLHADFIDDALTLAVESKVNGIHFNSGYRFTTGISQQLAAFMPLQSYFDFIADPTIYESIRAHNFELMQKGRSPFKKGHNYEFVRYLLRINDAGCAISR